MMSTKSDISRGAAVRHPMKVAFLCNSDNLGGAAVVTRRLVHAMRGEGVDARMIVFNKMSDDDAVIQVGAGRFRRGCSFMYERMRIAAANGFSRDNLFKVSLASSGVDPTDNEWLRQCDVIVLSWINQGLLSLDGIFRLGMTGKPVVWIMHDMWNLTGICHHAYECRNYIRECGWCQFLGSRRKPDDLSHTVWQRKKKLYDAVPITFVAVSNWLAGCCRDSGLLSGRDVRVIPNAFPVDTFATSPSMPFQSVPDGKKIVLMGAARLDDPIKGFPMAVEALNRLFDNYPEVARGAMAVFFGTFRDSSVLDGLRFPHVSLGMVNDAKYLRELYARASVILSASLYETLPGTLVEGLAAGCLPVTFGRGGQGDIVNHKVNGYIAGYKDTDDLAEGIRWALEQPVDRGSLHEQVRERFSSKTVACRYIELFRELLDRSASAEPER